MGLFGIVGKGGVIKNVGVINSYFEGGDYVGGVVGFQNGQISNSYNTGAVSGSEGGVGGIVGRNKGCVKHCQNTAVVHGQSESGDIVGKNKGIIEDCHFVENAAQAQKG